MITLTIDGREVKAAEGSSVLEAALKNGIYIPNLCWHPDLEPAAACRLCVVEIDGIKGFPTSCTTAVKEGMNVRADTPEIRRMRQDNIWLILSEYNGDPPENSQLAKVAGWIGKKEPLDDFKKKIKNLPVKDNEPLFIRDNNLCILCGRCVRICRDVRKTGVLGLANRGINTVVETAYGAPLEESGCKFCTACVEVCPSGALSDKNKFGEEDRQKVLLPCSGSCPAGIDVSRYVRLIAEGRFEDSLAVIRETVPFPAVLGCVCTHPCEEACRRGNVNEPIAIRALKKFAAITGVLKRRRKITTAADTGKKIAIVGSGPAGLTAAWFLRLLGHSVTVFERMDEPGGMMRLGIPEYRLPREILDTEIKDIENAGVVIKTGSDIGSLEKLTGNFNVLLLATGAGAEIKMGMPGEDSPGVEGGISFLQSINLGGKTKCGGETVAVTGGGNAAIDAARSALRLGAEKVVLLYRRTRAEMPAADEEIREALNEGVKMEFLVNPVKVERSGERLEIECVRMELADMDASGRRRPVPLKGSEFKIKADRLINAVGQRPEVPDAFGVKKNSRGGIITDPVTLATPVKGVFAGGDAVTGPASVIEAIQAGRIAASSIDKYLGGKGDITQKYAGEEDETPCLGRDEKFASQKRIQPKTLPMKERLKVFSEVEYVFDEKDAVEEAKRCLRCQLRLKISKVPMPPEKK